MTRLESCEALYPRCRRLHGTNLRVESRESEAESVEERKANFANAAETDGTDGRASSSAQVFGHKNCIESCVSED